jgi:hypothetical protein
MISFNESNAGYKLKYFDIKNFELLIVVRFALLRDPWSASRTSPPTACDRRV